MHLKRFFALALTFSLLAALLPAASAATVERVTITGAPDVLTVGQPLPTTGLTVRGAQPAAEALWFASSNGKDAALQKPLAAGSTAAAGKFYYLGLLLTADGQVAGAVATNTSGARINALAMVDGSGNPQLICGNTLLKINGSGSGYENSVVSVTPAAAKASSATGKP